MEEVIAGIGGERFRGHGISMHFCRNANSADLDKLFQIAMAEQGLTRRAELIWGFRRATAPIPERTIVEMLQSENEDIRDTAFYIMGNNPSPKAREYALSFLEIGEDVVNALSLLSKNILPEDERLFFDTIKRCICVNDKFRW